MGIRFRRDLFAALRLRQRRQQIGHGAARHEQAGLLADRRGCDGLEFLRCGVTVQPVIAERSEAMRAYIASVGLVTVSLRRSMGGNPAPAEFVSCGCAIFRGL